MTQRRLDPENRFAQGQQGHGCARRLCRDLRPRPFAARSGQDTGVADQRCAFCVHLHTGEARARGEREERLYLLDVWWESPLYSDRERAAWPGPTPSPWCPESRVPDAVYDEARRHFSEEEMVKLMVALGLINAWNRIGVGFRMVHPA